jgi:hypothetical protein
MNDKNNKATVESRLDRYAWAARHLDDLPNRPRPLSQERKS